MRKFYCCIGVWDGFSFCKDWYDGPYWYLSLGWIRIIWNLDGLPYIFQDKGKS
jgi:hypothetical protein